MGRWRGARARQTSDLTIRQFVATNERRRQRVTEQDDDDDEAPQADGQQQASASPDDDDAPLPLEPARSPGPARHSRDAQQDSRAGWGRRRRTSAPAPARGRRAGTGGGRAERPAGGGSLAAIAGARRHHSSPFVGRPCRLLLAAAATGCRPPTRTTLTFTQLFHSTTFASSTSLPFFALSVVFYWLLALGTPSTILAPPCLLTLGKTHTRTPLAS